MLPRYGRLGASSRLRMYQYAPHFARAGVEVAVSPLLEDAYVEALYSGRRAVPTVLAGYWRRLRLLLRKHEWDVVWIEKELLPWLPAVFERIRGWPAVAVDYDDAVFHRYDQHPNRGVRRLLGDKIDRVMANASLVTAGNRYLAERASAAGCQRVELLPTVVDLERYPVVARHDPAQPPLRIGWVGSPATADYLQMVAPVVAKLAASSAVEALAVGARPDQVQGTPFRAVPWAEETEVETISSFDIGIMPLPDAPWERGKCGYKLIQYMACGVPVIASPVGVNQEIVSPGDNGLLADGDDAWLDRLQALAADPQARERMGRAGRARVEEWYSLQAQAPRLLAMLDQLAKRH